MGERPHADILVHADWSVSPKKRWVARAAFDSGWTIEAVEPVGPAPAFVAGLLSASANRRVVAGFDFPIGLPRAYGERTGEAGFSAFLQAMGTGRWQRFADVAVRADEVSLERPFYPARSVKGVTRNDLIQGIGVDRFDELFRACERGTGGRRAACPIFWTLGGQQVGKGALSGWVELVKPAQSAGASIWPFDGALETLTEKPGLVIVETYPAEAYGHVGVRFTPSESKTRRSDRLGKAKAIHTWASRSSVTLAAPVLALIDDGFGESRSGEDPFDALMGLLGMIEVADGRRPASGPTTDPWEGWIIGQSG